MRALTWFRLSKARIQRGSQRDVLWRLLFCLFLFGCDERRRQHAPPSYLQPTVLDASADWVVEPAPARSAASSTAPLLPLWCGAERVTEVDAALHIGEITDAYLSAQSGVCAPLTDGMDQSTLGSWRTYVYDFTRVMAGCVDFYMPPPGGILSFGPANTSAVGVPRAPLSRGDAGLLIEAYVSTFASALFLASDARALVETHLWRTAEPEMDAGLGTALVLCSGGSDAGR